MLGIPHPYLTDGLPGVGGTIKEVPEDFIVHEVPLYLPCGEGEHTYLEVEKRDLSTLEALERMGRALGVDPREFGYAGLKDRKGVTRQTFSIAGVTPEAVRALEMPQLRVLSVTRHTNKLRVGHLRGNRFQLWVRGVGPDARSRTGAILEVLLAKGVPNYFGPQRFGNRGDAHRIGRALLRGEPETAVRRVLGHPATTEQNPHVVGAREAFMRGDLSAALHGFPPTYREERKLLAYLLQAGENWAGAARRIGPVTRKIYSTAYQSYLFNVSLSHRLELTGNDPGAFREGDVAFIHRNGALFRVIDLGEAATRAAAFEISPSGPIFGMKMLAPSGVQEGIEQEILQAEGLRVADFHQLVPQCQLDGGRRPFRVRLEDLDWDVDGPDLRIAFFLPKGSYATTVLRELTKNERVPDAFYEGSEAEKHRLWRHPAAPAHPDACTLPAEE